MMSPNFRVSVYVVFILICVAVVVKLSGPRNIINAQSASITLDYSTQVLNISSNAPSGEAAYLLRVNEPSPITGQAPLDLVFRTTGNGANQNKATSTNRISSDMAYPYSLSFSPTGQSLLIKTSYPTAWLDAYQVSFWNLKTKKLKQGPKIKYYPDTRWSPDDHFLAYFQGGDTNGDETQCTDPLQLYIYDLNLNKSRLVVQNPMAKSFAWTSKDTILYVSKSQLAGETATSYDFKRPSIFESALPPAVPTKIIQDGFDPIPSPNGKWIAFKGWADPHQASNSMKDAKQKKTDNPLPFGLYLFNRATKTRSLIHPLPLDAIFESLVWSPDSLRLFSVHNVYNSTHPPFFSSNDQKDYPGYGKGHVSVIELPTLMQHEITIITATDTIARINLEAQFSIQGLSRDGKSIFVRMNEDHKHYQYVALLNINIQTGAVQTIFDGQDVSEVDWHEVLSHALVKN